MLFKNTFTCPEHPKAKVSIASDGYNRRYMCDFTKGQQGTREFSWCGKNLGEVTHDGTVIVHSGFSLENDLLKEINDLTNIYRMESGAPLTTTDALGLLLLMKRIVEG